MMLGVVGETDIIDLACSENRQRREDPDVAGQHQFRHAIMSPSFYTRCVGNDETRLIAATPDRS
jgi:hypothetical protein